MILLTLIAALTCGVLVQAGHNPAAAAEQLDRLFARQSTTGTCSDSTPCENGSCCSTQGFCGYSPAFCGTGNCTSNCDAKAECGEYAVEGSQNCPLNVCCSQYGFCGTTSDFCGTGCQTGYGGTCGAVTEPSCSGSSAQQRIIAYYEGWSTEKTCQGYTPDQLNLVGFTHANFAFAYFDPDSFAITAMDATTMSMISQFTALKSKYSGLQTWISVGGWSFTDPGPTQAAWSTMASTPSNRAIFINNVQQFMQTYGFDGLDMDWEYPGASDRGGVAADGENFISLVKEMRAAFGGNYGISVTLPTSYWYLQGFQPVEMEQYVDWFNLMAYDLHGVWDATDIYIGPYIAPHTNLTEISEALDLLWMDGVDPGKVVLGQGWYGRSFTLADPSCNTPNGICQFTTGGNPGPCTATSGILSNEEIQNIISQYGVTPVYDEVDAVNWITWDTNQWVSFDDEVTYGQKLSFANDLCLGGMMVWAVDLNNQSSATGYGSQADLGLNETTTAYSVQQAVNTQAGLACYTSNCGQDCMPGYSGVTNMNGQPGYLPTAEDCPVGSVETLCCASGTTLGNCTWRGWRGVGLPCSGGCNSGETVATQNTNSHFTTPGGTLADQTCNGGLQSYCCDGFSAPSSLQTTVQDTDDDVSDLAVVQPVVSLVVATVTEALANAAKTILDAVATDFCEVAVPAFMEVIEDIELAIPIIGELAIIGEVIAEKDIVKACEDAVEDAGDAVLKWLGHTSSISVEDITETITETSSDFLCAPTECAGLLCANRKRKRSLGLDMPARQLDARATSVVSVPEVEVEVEEAPKAARTAAPELKLPNLHEELHQGQPALAAVDINLDQSVPFGPELGPAMKDGRGLGRREKPAGGGKSAAEGVHMYKRALSSPANGGLDAWAQMVFPNDASIFLDIEAGTGTVSTSLWEPFGSNTTPFYFVVSGLSGCTSLILISRCGAYMTHFWENLFRSAQVSSGVFSSEVIEPLVGSVATDADYWTSIPQLPQGCYAYGGSAVDIPNVNVQAIVFSRTTSSAGGDGVGALYPNPISWIAGNVSLLTDIPVGNIQTWLYQRDPDLVGSADSASGKIIVTFNPNTDGQGTAAYEVWAGGPLVPPGATSPLTPNSQINSPMMQDSWQWQ